MNIIRTTGTTVADGTLTLTLPLGQPLTEFEVVVVAHPHKGPVTAGGRFQVMDRIREQLAATGRDFGDSAEDIREDRDR